MFHTVLDEDTGEKVRLYSTPELEMELKAFNENECQHLQKEIREFTIADGSKQVVAQCLTCGERIGQAMKRTSVSSEINPADTILHTNYIENRNRTRNRIFQKHLEIQKSEERKHSREYLEYLESDAWKRRRDKVLNRADGTCEGCLENEATVVHHLTYEHMFDELLFELVALCSKCHDRCHGTEGNETSFDPEDLYDEIKCDGCRFSGEVKDEKPWCGVLDAPAPDVLASSEGCDHVYEPLK